MLDIVKQHKSWSKYEVEACLNTIVYAFNTLDIPGKTSIELKFEKKSTQWSGLTLQNSLKKYEVRLFHSSDIYDMIATVLHEMVHIKQFRVGELGYTPVLTWHDGTRANDVEYDKQPWEKEAFKLEKKLVKKLLTKP